MTSSIDIYRCARIVIRRHGDGASDHVQTMIVEHLSRGDRDAAGAWLAIGQAIEVLENRKPAGIIH